MEAPEVKEAEQAAVNAGPPKSVIREYFESIVVTLIMAIFGMTFILQAVTVPTGSMQNTILIGDYLLVNKFIFAPAGQTLPFLPQRDIKRGDIVVFKYPGNRLHPEMDSRRRPPIIPYQVNYVKRVIGLPGETVEFKNNQVFINGKLLPEHRITGDNTGDESALRTKDSEERKPDQQWDVYYHSDTMRTVSEGRDLPKNPYFEFGVPGKTVVVPENSYFCMGDARDDSEDSRVWGFVPRELIIGRAMFIYFSCDVAASGGCLSNPRSSRIGKVVR